MTALKEKANVQTDLKNIISKLPKEQIKPYKEVGFLLQTLKELLLENGEKKLTSKSLLSTKQHSYGK